MLVAISCKITHERGESMSEDDEDKGEKHFECSVVTNQPVLVETKTQIDIFDTFPFLASNEGLNLSKDVHTHGE